MDRCKIDDYVERGNKGFALLGLILKIDDIKWAVRLRDINPFRLNEYLTQYQDIRVECQKLGIPLDKYDSMLYKITCVD